VRDAHLRSADFFEVEKYPTIEFRTELRPTKDPEVWTVVGDLTIRGVTRPVELTMTYLGVWGDPWGGTRAGFEGTAKGRHEPVSESGAGRWISLGRRRAPHGPPTSAGSR
jgi:polyisoprenoid-binding protein YceI